MLMGAKSLSFLREPDFIQVFSQDGEVEKILEKRSNGKFKTNKQELIKMLHVRGYDRQLVINATLLQNYTYKEINEKLEEFANYLNFNQCEGVLELHPQDTTQNSFHFHFWTNRDDEYTYSLMKHWILTENLALEKNVDIQGKYAKFTTVTMPTKNGGEFTQYDTEQKKEMMKQNKEVVPLRNRIQESVIEEELVFEDREISKVVKRAKEILSRVEHILKRWDLTDEEEISDNKKKAIENFFHGNDKDDWRDQLSQIPKSDSRARIDYLKKKLNRE